MARLVLGPLLRHVGETGAVVWVETDSPCEVHVLGARQRSFEVEGHHFALVRATGLEPGTWHEYEVLLDGERAWPEPGSPFPPSRFRTYPKDGPLTVVLGSCRVCAPHEPPWTLTAAEDPRGLEGDALHAVARRMLGAPVEEWPDVLLLLGDQVYVDEVSPQTLEFIRRRRDTSRPPGERVLDFEEYARLYRESWGEPTIRWLLSTVSSAMIFDDHDVHDDWNTSAAWVEEMRAQSWWGEHVAAAIGSYWVYQHLGNLAPDAHGEDELLARLQGGDGAEALREFALRADRETTGARWSYCRDLGGTRLVVVDSRAGRVLDEGAREMVDEGEWSWLSDHLVGGHDHLLVASSLPWLLGRGMHWLEAWSEAVCGGAWGSAAARAGERLRRAMDLEHWAAFQSSFERLAELQRAVAAGERGAPPASIVTLSGDVHHAYLAEVAFPRDAGARSAVWQVVCSPFRHPLNANERRAVRLGCARPFEALARAAARAAGVPDPPVRWRFRGGGPWFDNQVATLVIDGRRIDARLERLTAAASGARLETVLEHRLA